MSLNNSLPVYFEGKKIYDIVYHSNFEGLVSFYNEYNADGAKKLCIVSDSKVASVYMDAILDISKDSFSKVVNYVFPEGEESKNLDTVKALYVKLIEEKFNRNDVLLALGGGVTGDMCGYAAATFLRGIDFIQVPTSLLADVDSSIGGKTGVDFDQYKNMVGAFHMPKLVYINLETLKSLDKRQFFSGMGEVVKSALIKDKELFDWLKDNIKTLSSFYKKADLNKDYSDINSIVGTFSDDSANNGYDDVAKSMDMFARKIVDDPSKYSFTRLMSHMIYSCNKIKKQVVEDDPHEITGERALLNYGHTLGHAIEKYMNFQLLHGECVSIGCILAAYISRNKGLISNSDVGEIEGLIVDNFDLPKLPKDIDIDTIISYTHSDKKAIGNTIKFILLDSIGNAIIRKDVTDSDMRDALLEYMKNYA